MRGDDVITPQQRQLSPQLQDLINLVRTSEFLVALDVITYGRSTPSRRDVALPIERWLSGLNADALLAAESAGANPQSGEFAFDGWRIRLEALPLKPEHRGDVDHRTLGYTGEGIAQLDDIGPILRRLKRKAYHYGELDRPYVIALLCAGTFVEPTDIEQALLVEIVGSHSPDQTFRWVRLRNGLWMRPNGPTNTRVSAVLTAIGLNAAAITAVEPRWWTNPWARHAVLRDVAWERADADAHGVLSQTLAAVSSAALFGLPERWPAE